MIDKLLCSTREGECVIFFCVPVYWDGAPLSLQVFRWRRKEWADFCAGTCWKRTPECPGWMPGRALAPCRPPLPKSQRHWWGGIKVRGGKIVSESKCIWTSEGKAPRQDQCRHTTGVLMCCEITWLTHLQAASCTRLLLSRIRLSSSVMSGFRYVSGGWLTTQWA